MRAHRRKKRSAGRPAHTEVVVGWQEIAGFFSRDLSPRTAQRWEQTRGLPVYRNPRPMAIKKELLAWMKTTNREGKEAARIAEMS
jgi:hypothetical protein